ncbi:hypothetical protein E1A91_D07G043300v1 [Gossypium mustelinum]|uniref:Uncharacterized protein n=1 Tax=Gossypium mustelinum TaxID=34275 RepID=A0A5D2U443_GOSMU|nr:hypothetical protein E1A91_D07G043300v1 [Gossypium mustelinum]
MASMLSSQGMVLATAMAVSGTVILLAFRYQKSFPLPHPSQQVLRSCISSGKKREKKKKKKVHFAEDVMEPRGDGLQGGEMPANRVALYHGILRDRGVQRLAYSY